jgi:hypothetical protein
MKHRHARTGVCQLCGCTYWRPCPEGCAWFNLDETLCTRCASALTWIAAVLIAGRRRN